LNFSGSFGGGATGSATGSGVGSTFGGSSGFSSSSFDRGAFELVGCNDGSVVGVAAGAGAGAGAVVVVVVVVVVVAGGACMRNTAPYGLARATDGIRARDEASKTTERRMGPTITNPQRKRQNTDDRRAGRLRARSR